MIAQQGPTPPRRRRGNQDDLEVVDALSESVSMAWVGAVETMVGARGHLGEEMAMH